MEDQILDAAGARITGGLLIHATRLADSDKGVFVMHPLQMAAFMRTGRNYYSNDKSAGQETQDLSIRDLADFPVNEIHFETLKGCVKIINVAEPE